MGVVPTFETQFLVELQRALAAEEFPELSSGVRYLQVHELVESHRPTSQFIYVVPKKSVPPGELTRILVGKVPGLWCLLLHRGQIAVVETLSRDVLQRYAE